eukprot:m.40127 g.40127  ORF g.40127 m.40127 type:complete len:65 (+) comp12727_c0_seq1:113-307(+)
MFLTHVHEDLLDRKQKHPEGSASPLFLRAGVAVAGAREAFGASLAAGVTSIKVFDLDGARLVQS